MKNILIFFLLLSSLSIGQPLTIGGSPSTVGGSPAKKSVYSNVKYIEFDGSDECMTFTALPVSAGFTVNAWILTSSYTTKGIFGVGTGATDYCRFTNTTQVYFVANSSGTTITHGHTFTTGAWQMVTIVRAADGTISIYRNAVAPTGTGSNTNATSIGQIARVSSGANYFQGGMDEVAIYNRPLSSTEITQLYGGGTPQTATNPCALSGLRGYWSFENVTSFPTVPDNSTAGRNGTCVNMESEDIKTFSK